MQDSPDKISLLAAVAKYLSSEELRHAVKDPALLFRLKIAAHLVESVAREEKFEEAHDRAELARLEVLFELPASSVEISASSRRAKIAELNRALATRLRAGETAAFTQAAHAHFKATLIDKLTVTTPRFLETIDVRG